MNLSTARNTFGLSATVLPVSLPETGGRVSQGYEALTTDYPTADVFYVVRFAGITNAVNPTLVLSTGVGTASGSTMTGGLGKDVFNVTIPTILTGYTLLLFRTDANAGVVSATGGTTAFKAKLSAGKRCQSDESTVITSDTMTFVNSTSAAATIDVVVLGKSS